ncbi:hypothetical protein QRX50_37245 [Amycolatopsis carbonis]|uniref:Uncharacterized protein n=1 Tax=Amycolatopsis carbonis TaxID=715471 RepID=A0A9Y2IDJ0_9PSEU|nr:hypothetical protein [Amycolatopsis sp. 2-15]WIX77016.1 hypothetical protein QRX50_37245 [Amycolatopsis sp. 2-15]
MPTRHSITVPHSAVGLVDTIIRRGELAHYDYAPRPPRFAVCDEVATLTLPGDGGTGVSRDGTEVASLRDDPKVHQSMLMCPGFAMKRGVDGTGSFVARRWECPGEETSTEDVTASS